MGSLFQPLPAPQQQTKSNPTSPFHNPLNKMNVEEPGRGGEHADVNITNRVLQRLPKTVRGHTVAAIGEFVGTM